MSALANKIAVEHKPSSTPYPVCSCGYGGLIGVAPENFVRHIAEVTEKTVHEQVAARIAREGVQV